MFLNSINYIKLNVSLKESNHIVWSSEKIFCPYYGEIQRLRFPNWLIKIVRKFYFYFWNQTDLTDRIEKYNLKKTEADPAKQVNELPLQDEDKLNPVFSTFCEDGQKYFEENPKDEVAEKYIKAIDEYLFMK